ncbi:unnamed protein product, partial [Scytosiphon promiscuus]
MHALREQRERLRQIEAEAEEERRRKQAEQQEQLQGLYRQQEEALRKRRGGSGRRSSAGDDGDCSRAPAYGGGGASSVLDGEADDAVTAACRAGSFTPRGGLSGRRDGEYPQSHAQRGGTAGPEPPLLDRLEGTFGDGTVGRGTAHRRG